MDAGRLGLGDDQFDGVFAPYLVNVVPDPVQVGVEMRRVCRPGGRIVLLNHFAEANPGFDPVDKIAGFLAAPTRARWDLQLDRFLELSGLTATQVEAVNLGGVSSVVVCRKP